MIWVDEDRPPVFAGGLDTERGPLEESSRAPRFFLRKRVAENFFSRLILLFSPADVPARNFSQILQLTILARPGLALRPRVPVIPPGQFLCSPVLAHPRPAFLGLAFQSSPWPVSLFPCSDPPQSAFLASRSSHPPGQSLCSLVLAHPRLAFLSDHSLYFCS